MTNKERNIYQENGYKNRREYLQAMSEEFDVPMDAVLCLAEILGEGEDFDGLVSSLEDYEDMYGEI